MCNTKQCALSAGQKSHNWTHVMPITGGPDGKGVDLSQRPLISMSNSATPPFIHYQKGHQMHELHTGQICPQLQDGPLWRTNSHAHTNLVFIVFSMDLSSHFLFVQNMCVISDLRPWTLFKGLFTIKLSRYSLESILPLEIHLTMNTYREKQDVCFADVLKWWPWPVLIPQQSANWFF